jgi:dTDP-4-dehydrorhamnose reductase
LVPIKRKLVAPTEIPDKLESMKIAITGSSGQLGKELNYGLTALGYKTFPISHEDLDISNLVDVSKFFEDLEVDCLVNCAGFTNVDAAENQPATAFSVNSSGPGNLANACRTRGIRLIHISTDSVFNSDSPQFFDVDDPTNPINIYSKSKDAGDKAVQATYPEGSWIVRTAWIYGAYGGKFVHAVLAKAQDDGPFEVVNDQFGQPMSTKALANFIDVIISSQTAPGIYHFCSADYVSRYDFALKIFEIIGADIHRIMPVPTLQTDLVAVRPKYSLLKTNGRIGNSSIAINSWESYLGEFLSLPRKAPL